MYLYLYVSLLWFFLFPVNFKILVATLLRVHSVNPVNTHLVSALAFQDQHFILRQFQSFIKRYNVMNVPQVPSIFEPHIFLIRQFNSRNTHPRWKEIVLQYPRTWRQENYIGIFYSKFQSRGTAQIPQWYKEADKLRVKNSVHRPMESMTKDTCTLNVWCLRTLFRDIVAWGALTGAF